MTKYKDRLIDIAPKLIAALEAHDGVVLPAVESLVQAEKADAWAEGYERGNDVANGDSDDLSNPYRTEAT